MSRILVIDDKEPMRDSVSLTLMRRGHRVSAAAGAEQGLAQATEARFDVVVSDLQMPGMDGLQLIARLREVDQDLPVVMMTAYATIETAVDAMKRGAHDYITKPFTGDELVVAVERAISHRRCTERASQRAESDSVEDAGVPELIGSSPAMSDLRAHIERIAACQGTVLIGGESGTGKEIAARRIHVRSERADRPFLGVNCAALSPSLLESELFGHERGAFTGAAETRQGRFELADGGTLLLDEISEMAPLLQAKLLRVLQEQTYERVGSSVARHVDVRVMATSNRDLNAEVRAGSFRQDLFFRLDVLPVAMPTLRERREDVDALAEHFLAIVAAREGQPVKRIDVEALDLFRSYAWPGNVRELKNICERAAVLATEDRITAALVAAWLAGPEVSRDEDTAIAAVCDGRLTLRDVERESILATLRHHDGHRQRSAEALGIGVRTLTDKLRRWKEQDLVPSSE